MRAALTWWSATVFVVLWLGLVSLLLTDADQFQTTGAWLRSQPIAVRAVRWVVFLPVAVGLLTWTLPSPAMRTVGIAVIVGWTAASAASLRNLLTGG